MLMLLLMLLLSSLARPCGGDAFHEPASFPDRGGERGAAFRSFSPPSPSLTKDDRDTTSTRLPMALVGAAVLVAVACGLCVWGKPRRETGYMRDIQAPHEPDDDDALLTLQDGNAYQLQFAPSLKVTAQLSWRDRPPAFSTTAAPLPRCLTPSWSDDGLGEGALTISGFPSTFWQTPFLSHPPAPLGHTMH